MPYLLSSVSHKMKFHDLEIFFFFNHEVGAGIKQQESALL